MRKLLVVMLAGLVTCGSAYAADTKTDMKKTDAMNPQQTKMKDCNDQAGDKKGDDRKAFMKTCLSAKPAKKEAAPVGFTWKDFYTPPVGPWFGPDWPVGRPIKKYGFCWVNTDVALRDQFGYWKVC